MHIPAAALRLIVSAILVESFVRCAPQQQSPQGLVNHVEGDVYLNAKRISADDILVARIHASDTVVTNKGRAEVLLAPGVFVRAGENSTLKVISIGSKTAALEVLKGNALLEVSQISRIQIVINGECSLIPSKPGLYELDATKRYSKVYSGEALLQSGRLTEELKRGYLGVMNGATLQVSRFNPNIVDELYLWSAETSEFDAEASYGVEVGLKKLPEKTWYWNPRMHSWAFVPVGGIVTDSFGFAFAAPRICPMPCF